MDSTLVYSTEKGFGDGRGPGGRKGGQGTGHGPGGGGKGGGPKGPPKDGKVRVQLETKGRKGKGVTVVFGLPLDEAALAALAKELKVACGSGGTVKDGTIEIQGDHRETLLRELTRRGHKAIKAGG